MVYSKDRVGEPGLYLYSLCSIDKGATFTLDFKKISDPSIKPNISNVILCRCDGLLYFSLVFCTPLRAEVPAVTPLTRLCGPFGASLPILSRAVVSRKLTPDITRDPGIGHGTLPE